MSPRDGQVSDASDADEQAVLWYARRLSGEASAADQIAFAKWSADPDNAHAYAELEAVWTHMRPAAGPRARQVMARRERGRPTALRKWAIAATLALATGLGIQYERVWRHDIIASGPRLMTETLEDGSRLTLAPGTAIDIHYQAGKRRISLARGEAYFDIVHNPGRPFVIDAGSATVSVLGTAFSISRAGDEGRVVVERGTVRVAGRDRSVDLLAGQATAFNDIGPATATNVNPTTQLSWVRGRLIFENRPLGEVLTRLGQYHGGYIILRNELAATRPVSAAVDLDKIDRWLDALGQTQHLTIRRLPGLIIIG